MWPVEHPDLDAGETFATCISRVQDKTVRGRLTAIRPNIEAAANDYVKKAKTGNLHLIQQMETIDGVSGQELVKTYDSRMAKKGQPGRLIYDQIKLLPDGDRCPFCDHRNVSTLDHFLPKQRYPIFAVAPINLVGACRECNTAKSNVTPISEDDTLLHSYFDKVNEQQWLFARVARRIPAALIFYVSAVAGWSDILNARIAHQFDLLGLAALYASQAAREITDIRQNLQQHFDNGEAAAVRAELRRQRKSRQANRVNSWQTATYQALAESDWFCDKGFAETGL